MLEILSKHSSGNVEANEFIPLIYPLTVTGIELQNILPLGAKINSSLQITL